MTCTSKKHLCTHKCTDNDYTIFQRYLHPGDGANYGWIKGKKCADICDVAQVTDIRTLPN